jgi:CheY-like chemotaxis protein
MPPFFILTHQIVRASVPLMNVARCVARERAAHRFYDLVRALRTQASPATSIPAVALTAYARAEDRERALAAGFQVHLPKPIVARDLISTIEHLAPASRK